MGKKTLDIVASGMFYRYDINTTYNNIFQIPWCHWFLYTYFYIYLNGLDTKKIFLFLRRSAYFIIHVHLWSTGTSPNLELFVSYHFTLNISQSQGIYSPQSHYFTNQCKTTTHFPNIAIFLYYYYIIHKLNIYYQKIQFSCLGPGTTYWSILPIVTKNGCVGVTYNFISHKSTKFGNFLSLKTFLSSFNIVLHLHNIKIIMKATVKKPTKVIFHVEKCITSFWVSIPTHLLSMNLAFLSAEYGRWSIILSN